MLNLCSSAIICERSQSALADPELQSVSGFSDVIEGSNNSRLNAARMCMLLLRVGLQRRHEQATTEAPLQSVPFTQSPSRSTIGTQYTTPALHHLNRLHSQGMTSFTSQVKELDPMHAIDSEPGPPWHHADEHEPMSSYEGTSGTHGCPATPRIFNFNRWYIITPGGGLG